MKPRKLLLGLVGSGIAASLSPALHEREAAQQGLHALYQLIDLDAASRGPNALADVLKAAQCLGFAGLNVTYPCKQTVLSHLDVLSDEAKAIGAVNTVVFEGGKRVGHNTDASGWRDGFERAMPGADMDSVVLLGAGGAGAAIAHAVLALRPGKLSIFDADPLRAEALLASVLCNPLSKGISVAVARTVDVAMHGATGLIHATPTGMAKLPGLPLDESLLRPHLWVSEVVYFPLETELLRVARARGLRCAHGGGMAVGQAVGAFRLFSGLPANAARMAAHFDELIQAR